MKTIFNNSKQELLMMPWILPRTEAKLQTTNEVAWNFNLDSSIPLYLTIIFTTLTEHSYVLRPRTTQCSNLNLLPTSICSTGSYTHPVQLVHKTGSFLSTSIADVYSPTGTL